MVQEAGGSTYSSTSACGQLHQSYQADKKLEAMDFSEICTSYIPSGSKYLESYPPGEFSKRF